MAEVGRPPVLRGRQDLVHVAGQLVEIQGRELLGVVEVLAPRIGGAVGLSQDPQVEPVGPPGGLVSARRRFLTPPQRADGLVVRPVDVRVGVPRHCTPPAAPGPQTPSTRRTARAFRRDTGTIVFALSSMTSTNSPLSRRSTSRTRLRFTTYRRCTRRNPALASSSSSLSRPDEAARSLPWSVDSHTSLPSASANVTSGNRSSTIRLSRTPTTRRGCP